MVGNNVSGASCPRAWGGSCDARTGKITESLISRDSVAHKSDYSFVPKGTDIPRLNFMWQTLPNINFQML